MTKEEAKPPKRKKRKFGAIEEQGSTVAVTASLSITMSDDANEAEDSEHEISYDPKDHELYNSSGDDEIGDEN